MREAEWPDTISLQDYNNEKKKNNNNKLCHHHSAGGLRDQHKPHVIALPSALGGIATTMVLEVDSFSKHSNFGVVPHV